MNDIERRIRSSLRALDETRAGPLAARTITHIQRRRAMRSIVAGVAAAVVIAGAALAFPGSGDEDRPAPAGSATPVVCDGDAFMEISHRVGNPGRKIVVSGRWTSPLGQDGQRLPAERIEVYWRTGSDERLAPVAVPLLALDAGPTCYFSGTVRIPEGESGVYLITAQSIGGETTTGFAQRRFWIPERPEVHSASEYQLIYSDEEMDVYGPGDSQAFGWCPEAPLPLNEGDLATIVRVLENYASTSEEESFREVEVDVHLGPKGVFDYQTKLCGDEIAQRTAVADAVYPAWMDSSASIGSAIYYVVKEERGWVVWDTY